MPNYIYMVATGEFEIVTLMGLTHFRQRVEIWRPFRISKRLSSTTAHLMMAMSRSFSRSCSATGLHQGGTKTDTFGLT
ncbi:MAG: hypothetical protein OXN84_02685 [Albidovulum sp.]|nr:hypothetical protein [Albidovulum sp.]